jgi:hypothetical protein
VAMEFLTSISLPRPPGYGGFGMSGLHPIKLGSAWKCPARKKINSSS